MAEVAAQLYRSPEHFSRQFKEEVGENFSSYLTRYRLERAQELLQTTDRPARGSDGGQNRDKKIKIVTFPAPCGKRYHIRPKNGQAYGSTVFVFFVKLNL